MGCSSEEVLYTGDSVQRAFEIFRTCSCSTLPVISDSGLFAGVVRMRDLLGANEREKIASYVSQDFLRAAPMMSDRELLHTCGERAAKYAEVYIVDATGHLVDVVDLLATMQAKVHGFQIETEEEFLQQILRPTSLARCILDGLNDGVVLVDRTGLIRYANSAYGKILRVDHQRVINHLISAFEPQSKIMEVISTGQPWRNIPIKLKSLSIMVMANITPILFRETIVAAISVFTDVTGTLEAAHAVEKAQLLQEVLTQALEDQRPAPDGFFEVIGTSLKLRKQLEMAAKIAPVDAPVLILGESGTGKELLAHSMHKLSPRRSLPFVSINCSAIPENLMESELFGYEEGAFTGSKKGGKRGKLDHANGGTLFLDEIGDMPVSMQTKILRFLQEKEFERVGGLGLVRVDIRVLAATNKNLSQMVQERTFRDDLYYRLNVFTITLPPLRERKIDILLMVEHFKKQYENRYKKNVEFSSGCLRRLVEYGWPGNVRELKNVIEHAVLLAESPIVTEKHLPSYFPPQSSQVHSSAEDDREPRSLDARLKLVEKQAILDALQASGYNKTKAMQMLDMSRRTFYKRLKELGILLFLLYTGRHLA